MSVGMKRRIVRMCGSKNIPVVAFNGTFFTHKALVHYHEEHVWVMPHLKNDPRHGQEVGIYTHKGSRFLCTALVVAQDKD